MGVINVRVPAASASARRVEDSMAKVVYAAGTQMDPRLMAELASLRARVAELERENSALRLENETFDDEVRSLAAEPPVLA
ncbi:MAG: hypothetical protein U0R28_03720 [Candidatus Nanopelagicales bacterium]